MQLKNIINPSIVILSYTRLSSSYWYYRQSYIIYIKRLLLWGIVSGLSLVSFMILLLSSHVYCLAGKSLSLLHALLLF